MKSVPPLDEVFGMAGLALPEMLGKKQENVIDVPFDTTAESTKAENKDQPTA